MRKQTYRKIALRILPILFLAYIIANVDRNNVGLAKLGFARDLGFSDAVFGVGAGLFYLGYMCFEIPSNLLLARIGARLTLLRIMLLWCVVGVGYIFMTKAWHYCGLRMLLGAAEAGFFPGVLLYLTYWVPKTQRARFTALFMSAIPVGGMVGSAIAGATMQGLEGVAGLHGWQWLFIIEALPAALMGLVCYFWLSDRPEQASWLSPASREVIAADLRAEEEQKVAEGTAHPSPFAAFREARFWLIGGMAVALLSCLNGLNLWAPTIIKNSGVNSLFLIGLMASLPHTVGIPVQILNAWHSDRTQERRWHVAVPGLAAAASWLLMPYAAGRPVLSLLLLVTAAAGLYGITGPFWTIPSRYLSGTSAAAGIAMVTTVGGLGSLVSPAIVGWLSTETGSLAIGQCYYGLVLILGVTMLLIGTRLSHASAPRTASQPA
jgi:sugar phosphate permease